MDMKQLRSFVEIVENGSFTKAAEKLYMSQPTISMHVKLLEEELGAVLIDRSKKKLEPTEKGMELFGCAVRILDMKENLVRYWEKENHTEIRIGASTVPAAYYMPEILSEYHKITDKVSFNIVQGDSLDMLRAVKTNSVDFAFVGMDCNSPDIECEPIAQDRLVLAAKAGYKPMASIEEMLREPMIIREQGSGSRKKVLDVLERFGLSEEDLQITARVKSQEAIREMIAWGVGVSILSESAVEDYVKDGKITVYELPEDISVRNLNIIYSKKTVQAEPMRLFVSFVRQLTRKRIKKSSR